MPVQPTQNLMSWAQDNFILELSYCFRFTLIFSMGWKLSYRSRSLEAQVLSLMSRGPGLRLGLHHTQVSCPKSDMKVQDRRDSMDGRGGWV